MIINIIIVLIMEKNKSKTKKSMKTLIKVHIKNIIYDKKISVGKNHLTWKLKKNVLFTLRAKERIFIRFAGSKLKYNIYICQL